SRELLRTSSCRRPPMEFVWNLEYQTQAVVLRAMPPPQVVIISPLTADPEAGLFHKTVTLSNNGSDPMLGARIYFPDLPAGRELFNAAGAENGVSYVETDALIPAASHAFSFDTSRHSLKTKVIAALDSQVTTKRRAKNSVQQE